MKQFNRIKQTSQPLDIYVLEMGIFVCNLREAASKRDSELPDYQEAEPLVTYPSLEQRWPNLKSQ